MKSKFYAAALALSVSFASHGVFAATDADDFVEEASAKGVAEVEAGKLAEEKGTAADVKAFGAMIVKDHTAANEKLKAIADQKKLEVSTDAELLDKAKSMILDLRSAKSFDQAYSNNQVKAHEATIEIFKDEIKNADDAQLKEFATATLPKLQAHLEQAKALAKNHGGDAGQ